MAILLLTERLLTTMQAVAAGSLRLCFEGGPAPSRELRLDMLAGYSHVTADVRDSDPKPCSYFASVTQLSKRVATQLAYT